MSLPSERAVTNVFPPLTPGKITPTDVSQFIRLEQCERYLRLRLHERTANPRFMADYGVAPQSIPSLLTRSGAAFERAAEWARPWDSCHFETTYNVSNE